MAGAETPTFTSYDLELKQYDRRYCTRAAQAVAAAVRPGDVVVDAGSARGLPALWAAQRGAERVYAVATSSDSAEIIAGNARANNMQDKIRVVLADMVTFEPPEPVDVAISMDITHAGGFGPQLFALNNLLRYLKPEGARVLPGKIRNQVSLLDARTEFYGLQFCSGYRYHAFPEDRVLTSARQYHVADFSKRRPVPTEVDARVGVRAVASGVANAIRLSSVYEFAPGVPRLTRPTPTVHACTLLLPGQLALEAGRTYDVSLGYSMEMAPDTMRVDIAPRPA